MVLDAQCRVDPDGVGCAVGVRRDDDAVAPASNTGVSYPGYYSTTDNGTPFFTTTDPANFANPSAYAGDPGVIAMAPYYTGNAGYFILPTRKAHYAYCPPRGGRGYSHARGGGRHR